eukprot:gene16915-21516_t
MLMADEVECRKCGQRRRRHEHLINKKSPHITPLSGALPPTPGTSLKE